MAFLTDRKRAVGLGSAKTGTEHHWSMTISSVALFVLMPVFAVMVGRMLGQPHDEVIAFFSRPLPAILTALTFLVGMMHFKGGVQVLIEDYTDGMTRKALVIVMTCVSYFLAAAGLFAVARIAF